MTSGEDDADWSPDDSHLVFESEDNGNGESTQSAPTDRGSSTSPTARAMKGPGVVAEGNKIAFAPTRTATMRSM